MNSKLIKIPERTCFFCGFWVPKCGSALAHHSECLNCVEHEYPALWQDAMKVDMDIIHNILNPLVPAKALTEKYRDYIQTVDLAEEAMRELIELYNRSLANYIRSIS